MVLFGAVSLAAGRALAQPPAPAPVPDAQAILAKADRVKTAWTEAVLTLKVTTTRPGAPPAAGTFEVAVKGDRSRIRFLRDEDKGKFVLTKGDDAWLLLPNAKNPIRIPKSHRLEGGFSAADLSRTRFSEDYDAVIERSDTLNGRDCWVVRLNQKKDRAAPFPIARMWVDKAEGLYRKGIFLLSSGRTAKETSFDGYRTFHGSLALEKMTIVDALRPGTTVVEYLDYVKRPVPDDLFDLQKARTAELR